MEPTDPAARKRRSIATDSGLLDAPGEGMVVFGKAAKTAGVQARTAARFWGWDFWL